MSAAILAFFALFWYLHTLGNVGRYVARQSPNIHWKQPNWFTPFGWTIYAVWLGMYAVSVCHVFDRSFQAGRISYAFLMRGRPPVELREHHSAQNITICWNHPITKNSVLGLAPPKANFSPNINNYCCLGCSRCKYIYMCVCRMSNAMLEKNG